MTRFALFAVLALTACTPTTTLTGCISTQTPGGDRKPGADAVVMVIPGSSDFEREWQANVVSFVEEYRTTRGAYDDARARYRAARAAEQSALKAQRRAPVARVHEDAAGTRVWSNQTPPSVWQVANARSDAARGVAEAGRRLNGVIDRHITSAIATIDRHQTGRTRTDARGCYVLTGVPSGTVYLLANYGDRYWFSSVDTRSSTTVDFVPDRSGWPFVDAMRSG